MTPKERKAALGFIAGCDEQAARLKAAAPKLKGDERKAITKAAKIYANLARDKRRELYPE